ncbi:MAG: dihydroneopterin triphosphate diphosphatase [Betaproteobacteria bacterium]|nr:dihydroneopterin triphosphate diphosphatase [Betaproteobacteria bacterium]
MGLLGGACRGSVELKQYGMSYKIPVSVLVVIYTSDRQVLLLERADHPGYWQSVTGSSEPGESLRQTAVREVREETGLDAEQYPLTDWDLQFDFEIFAEWRHRYAPGVTHNAEHVFGLELPQPVPIKLEPREHLNFIWMPHQEAAKKVFSWTNAAAIERLHS